MIFKSVCARVVQCLINWLRYRPFVSILKCEKAPQVLSSLYVFKLLRNSLSDVDKTAGITISFN